MSSSGDASSRTGYEFMGWNTDVNDTDYSVSSSYILNNDITLYAKWKEVLISEIIYCVTITAI